MTEMTKANLGGEDFACYVERVPGCFVRYGAALPDGDERPAHSSRFDFDERALAVGAAWLAEVAREAGRKLGGREPPPAPHEPLTYVFSEAAAGARATPHAREIHEQQTAEDRHAPDDQPDCDGLAQERPPEQHRHDRVHVRVRADLRTRHVRGDVRERGEPDEEPMRARYPTASQA